jgi:asparagine synthase (glutamine-hydrolysing)
MVKAREVANYLGTVHHEFCFSVQDGLDAIKKVIWHIESYDVTTVRASTPMYLLARCVKAVGVKMVLSGEGSDEIFGGYLYFHQAPDAESFHRECVRRVRNLHLSDCLRANKATAAWGVEIRVPFLDKDFLDVAMNIDPREKMCSKGRIEKWILRKAFDTPENPYLPQSILWRQKEQFSDGVGYSWIDSLKKYAESEVSDDEFAKRHELFPLNTPTTKEAFFYRKIFHELFPNPSAAATVQLWVPTWSVNKDPSGRAQVVHQSTTEKN